jgi:hypothetical protein
MKVTEDIVKVTENAMKMTSRSNIEECSISFPAGLD